VLGHEKVMKKTVKHPGKMLALLVLAYGVGLIAGELLRGKLSDRKPKPLYSWLFVLLKAGRHLV